MKCECGKEIYFLTTTSGSKMPVNKESMTPMEVKCCELNSPVPFDPNRHISHYSDCPLAVKFRKVYKNPKEASDGKMPASRLPEQG